MSNRKCKYLIYNNKDGIWLSGYCLFEKNHKNNNGILLHNVLCKFKDCPEKCPHFRAAEEK